MTGKRLVDDVFNDVQECVDEAKNSRNADRAALARSAQEVTQTGMQL